MNDTPKRRWNAFVLLALTLLLVGCGLGLMAYWSSVRASNRRLLTVLAENVKTGDSKATVRQVFEATRSSSGIKFYEYDADCWWFKTPLEFGASNWILIVAFDGDVVEGVGVRTADSIAHKPRQAPADVVRKSAEKRWKSRFGPQNES